MSRFDIEKACRLIQDYRISFIYVPPPIVLALAKHPAVEKYDLTSLRVLNSGAAPLTRELAEALWDRHSIPVKQGYGLSETSPTTHIQSPDDWKKFIGSVGKLVNNMEARIVDLDGNDVPDGVVCLRTLARLSHLSTRDTTMFFLFFSSASSWYSSTDTAPCRRASCGSRAPTSSRAT